MSDERADMAWVAFALVALCAFAWVFVLWVMLR